MKVCLEVEGGVRIGADSGGSENSRRRVSFPSRVDGRWSGSESDDILEPTTRQSKRSRVTDNEV